MMQCRLFFVMLLMCGVAAAQPQDVRKAVVKVYTTYASPQYYTPWNVPGPAQRTGSGSVISGKRILTNAHIVGDETFIQVRRFGDPKKYRAHVLFVSHTVDLALLSVDDESFFDGIEPLNIDGLPELQTEVMVLGYPLGGDTLSATKGVISRIEHRNYSHSSFGFLAGQIDAAINPGNSGGPVMNGDDLIGVVMQGLSEADNIGYMVPVPVIQHFLDDVADGQYNGVPDLGLWSQKMDNESLKRASRMSEEQTGVLVYRMVPGSASDGILLPGDVITSIDGYSVADDETIEFRENERTSYSYRAELKQVGQSIPVTIWRDGQSIEKILTFSRPVEDELIVPRQQYDIQPTYYIVGGLVFNPLTLNYLSIWSSWYENAPKDLVNLYVQQRMDNPEQEVVILGRVLADDVNRGYHDWNSWVIDFVNGEKINNLKELIQKVENSPADGLIVFSDAAGRKIVIDSKEAREANQDILKRYRVSADRSDDLIESRL